MSVVQNLNVQIDVANALAGGAGMSESTVEAQHTRAIAVLTAKVANTATEASAITAAIALLNTNLAHIRDPRGH